MTHPRALAAGTDGERIVIYVCSPAGMMPSEEAVQISLSDGIRSTSGDTSKLGGGIYRLTMVLTSDGIYLPLLER